MKDELANEGRKESRGRRADAVSILDVIGLVAGAIQSENGLVGHDFRLRLGDQHRAVELMIKAI